MASFIVSEKPHAQWAGGPPNRCAVCNFENPGGTGFLILPDVHINLYDNVEVPLHLCLEQHAKELKSVLDEIFPDDRLPKLQGELLSAHAQRARAERRAEKAEAALYAMQDWVSEKPAVLSPGGK